MNLLKKIAHGPSGGLEVATPPDDPQVRNEETDWRGPVLPPYQQEGTR